MISPENALYKKACNGLPAKFFKILDDLVVENLSLGGTAYVPYDDLKKEMDDLWKPEMLQAAVIIGKYAGWDVDSGVISCGKTCLRFYANSKK